MYKSVCHMKRKHTWNSWVNVDRLSPEEKLPLQNYHSDYYKIESAMESLTKVKYEVLPKYKNLQTSAFSVILDTICSCAW